MQDFPSFYQSSFYEYITFVSSSMLFMLFLFFGFSTYSNSTGLKLLFDFTKISTGIVILIFMIFFMISHVYGQLISALSEKIIGKPLKLLNKKIIKNNDYDGNFTEIIKKYKLYDYLPNDKKNNKWTLLYYILTKKPEVGEDLFKRYAREKVSRINSLNFLILVIISILLKVFYPNISNEILIFSTNIYLFIVSLLFFLSVWEYFKRKTWNHDLLIKAAVIFIEK